jgi:hypothetical protein
MRFHSKVLACYPCNFFGKWRWEEGPRSRFHKPIAIASVCQLCFVLSSMDRKIEQHFCIQSYMKRGKSATETLEILHKDFGEHSLSCTMVFWMVLLFQGQSSVSWRWQTFRATKHRETTENVDKIREFFHEDCCQTIHELIDTTGISYGVCYEILTESLYIRHIATSSRQHVHPHIP